MLSREQLLGSFQREYVTVETPIGQLKIRNWSEAEREDVEKGNMTAEGKPNLTYFKSHRRRIVQAAVVNEDGSAMFDQPGDMERLRTLDARVITAIWNAAVKHCGYSAEEIQELEKNCAAAAGDGSPTA